MDDRIVKGANGKQYYQRDFSIVRTISEFGKTRSIIECPFCHDDVEAYHWSLAGSGKKCTCGVKFGWMYGALKAVDNT